MAPTAPSRDRAALRAEDVIRGYHADVALEALGRHVQALIAVRIRPQSRENIDAFRDWAAGLPELIGVFVVSGEQDFLLHLGVKDTDALTRSSSTVSPSARRSPTSTPPSSTSTSAAPRSNRSTTLSDGEPPLQAARSQDQHRQAERGPQAPPFMRAHRRHH